MSSHWEAHSSSCSLIVYLYQSSVATTLWSESDRTKWIDDKPKGSVLYVSFGSYAHTTKRDIAEIAHGLMIREVNFIWVLRPDIISSNEKDFIPDDYENLVKGRGLIVPWCFQIAVISHPASCVICHEERTM